MNGRPFGGVTQPPMAQLFQSIDGRDPIDKLDKFNVNKIKPNAGN
jgi:hypothetical protein